MIIPFIVGTGIAILLLLLGIIGLLVSKQRGARNKWSWWLILFGCCAIVSAIFNL